MGVTERRQAGVCEAAHGIGEHVPAEQSRAASAQARTMSCLSQQCGLHGTGTCKHANEILTQSPSRG